MKVSLYGTQPHVKQASLPTVPRFLKHFPCPEHSFVFLVHESRLEWQTAGTPVIGLKAEFESVLGDLFGFAGADTGASFMGSSTCLRPRLA